jgi:hypothetical protein
MSSIDKYKRKSLGFIQCPSTLDFVYNNPTRKIAVYELMENIPAGEKDFDGKMGDIILGGGSGETPAFRISIPEAILFFNKTGSDDFKKHDDLFKAFWNPTQSYILCDGFSKIGWNQDIPIEFWLAENIISLLHERLTKYSDYVTNSLVRSSLDFVGI